MTIERQTQSVPGAIRGPGTGPHQVRTVNVQIEALPTGQLRITTPSARGWAAVVRSQNELSRAITSAFTEAQCAAYAKWRGEGYDLDRLTDHVPDDPMAPPRPTTRRRTNTSQNGWGRNQLRPDAYPPDEWHKRADGCWVSPAGMVWKPGTTMVRRVIERRRQAGLPI